VCARFLQARTASLEQVAYAMPITPANIERPDPSEPNPDRPGPSEPDFEPPGRPSPDPVPWHDPGPPVREVDLPPNNPGRGIPVEP
jgi:hypothetical protein